MTHRELEAMVGRKVDAKVVMVLLPDGTWHRLDDGSWEKYPDSPEAPDSKNV